MSNAVNTDTAPLYAIRRALVEFQEDVGSVNVRLRECFQYIDEQLNITVNKKIREIEERQRKASEAAGDSEGGRSDTFICDASQKHRLKLKVYGNTTHCRIEGCNGTMRRYDGQNAYDQECRNMDEIRRDKDELEEIKRLVREYSNEKENLIAAFGIFSGSSGDTSAAVSSVSLSIEKLEDYLGVDISSSLNNDDSVKKNDNTMITDYEAYSSPEEKLHNLGITEIDLTSVNEQYKPQIVEAICDMYEKYPSLQGFVYAFKTYKLDSDVFACAGTDTKVDAFQPLLYINEDLFANDGLEQTVAKYGESGRLRSNWLAVGSIEGIVKHELGHLLHLQAIANEEQLTVGEINREKVSAVRRRFKNDDIAAGICAQAMNRLSISSRDIGAELSRYGHHSFGECFAEAISEYTTSPMPRRFASEISQGYHDYIRQGRVI